MGINYVTVNGRDIGEVVNRIKQATIGVPDIHVGVACIVVAALSQNPELSPEKLQECVQHVSEFIATVVFEDKTDGKVN